MIFLLMALLFVPVFAQTPDVIKICYLLPLTGQVETQGNAVKDGLTLALQDVERDGLLNGTNLVLAQPITCDTTGDRATGVECALFLVDAGCQAVIGEVKSSVSIVAQIIFKKYVVPECSPVSTSLVLSDNVEFPTFFRTVTPDDQRAVAIAAMLQDFDLLNAFGTIAAEDDFSLGLSLGVSSQAVSLGGRNALFSITHPISFSNAQQTLATIRKTKARAIVMINFAQDAFQILEEARKLGIQDDYVWIGADQVAEFPTIFARNATGDFGFNGTATDIDDVMFVVPSLGSGPINEDVTERYLAMHPGEKTIAAFTPEAYDCLITLVRSLAKLPDAALLAVPNNSENVAAQTVRKAWADLSVLESFLGASGNVSFDAKGDRSGTMDIFQLIDGVATKRGTWSNASGVVYSPRRPIFQDSFELPGGVRLDLSTLSESARVVLLLAGMLALALGGLVALWLCRYRRTRLVYASSTLFSAYHVLGGCLVALAALIHVLPKTQALCVLVPLLFNSGFTVAVGSVAIKVYRLQRIFNQKGKFKHVKLTNGLMSLLLLILVGLDLVLLAAAAGSGMLELNPSTAEGVSCVLPTEGTRAARVFFSLLILFKATLVGLAYWYCYLTRHIPPTFNDNQPIILTLNTAVMVGVVWVIASVFELEYRNRLLLDGACMLVGVLAMLFVMFVPKMYKLCALHDMSFTTDTRASQTVSAGNCNRDTLEKLEASFDSLLDSLRVLRVNIDNKRKGLQEVTEEATTCETTLREMYMEVNWQRLWLGLDQYDSYEGRCEPKNAEDEVSASYGKKGSAKKNSKKSNNSANSMGSVDVPLSSRNPGKNNARQSLNMTKNGKTNQSGRDIPDEVGII